MTSAAPESSVEDSAQESSTVETMKGAPAVKEESMAQGGTRMSINMLVDPRSESASDESYKAEEQHDE